jgi:dienelactone hydrolase
MKTRGLHHGIWLLALPLSPLLADGPGDNVPAKVRPVPPPGVEVPAADRAELEAGVAELDRAIAALEPVLKDQPRLAGLLPDVRIFHHAVRYALAYHEFFDLKEIPSARELLRLGRERAAELAAGKAPWTEATGLVVRGYVSKIDGSVQPYGLVVPPSYRPGAPHHHRLDAWFHGRGETLSELNFLTGRLKSPGEFTPPDAFVLHLYGRYCNANKFAGEVDLFEALADVKRRYPIDEDRIAVRGFSMGGAACWQFAVHHAGLWAAAAPGAGFAETRDFLKVFQREDQSPPWYVQKLWHLYDCTDWAVNLANCPTVAYSGEIDKQKQAADIMARALAEEGIELAHVIGPGTAHSYHPAAREEINRRLDAILARGRDPAPRRVRFTTWTLRYHQMLWVTVEGLERHWSRARVDAEVLDERRVRAATANVSALTFAMPAGLAPLDITARPVAIIDGQELEAPRPLSDRSWRASFVKTDGRWALAGAPSPGTLAPLRKKHGLQGPIDDAFLDAFIFVTPSGKPLHEPVGAWAAAEARRAVEHWRKQFRGEARVKADAAITDADIAGHNLVLWGDPASNQVLARIAGKLPLSWDAERVTAGARTFPAATHAAILIYPNPLNPERYVVLNSGFTFREYDYLNNARQVPRLPDWAVVDITEPPSPTAPGKIAAAGFFGEGWELLPEESAPGG